jgi:hypothetical protein
VIKTVCDVHKGTLFTIHLILIHSHTLSLRLVVEWSFSSKDRILFCRHCTLWILIDSSEIIWWHRTHICIAAMLVIRCINGRERPLVDSICCSVKQFIYSWFKKFSIHIAKELAALMNIDFTSQPAVIKISLWFLETRG